jgi:hypothetical protein
MGTDPRQFLCAGPLLTPGHRALVNMIDLWVCLSGSAIATDAKFAYKRASGIQRRCRAISVLVNHYIARIAMSFRLHFSRTLPLLALVFSGLTAVSASHAEGRFLVSADAQEVTDTQSKLVWQRCALGQKWDGKTCAGKATKVTLADAKAKAGAMTPAWRVPTKDELKGLVDPSAKKPAIDKIAFPGTPAALFWAIKPEATDNLGAWVVDFRNGKVFGNTYKAKYLVRLVRAS